MIVLGIESSCDETAAALVRDDGLVLADVVSSQVADHAPYGGIVPEVAARAHLRAIVPVIERALASLPGGMADVDAVAVTTGPGLIGALLVGAQVGEAMARARGVPFVGVNHLDGHLLAVYLRRGDDAEPPPMPFVGLLASGGHTALYRVDDPRRIEMLGQTRDDAAGECFDKVAKLLGLGYPGGPIIDRLAARGDARAVTLPVPMLDRESLAFSFSGLKTAVARHVQKHGVPRDEAELADVCASVQRSIVEPLARKAVAACEETGIRHLVLAGGVAANRGLRARAAELARSAGVTLHVPPVASCTDNAAMIAYAGIVRLRDGEADPHAAVYSRDPERRRGRFPG